MILMACSQGKETLDEAWFKNHVLFPLTGPILTNTSYIYDEGNLSSSGQSNEDEKQGLSKIVAFVDTKIWKKIETFHRHPSYDPKSTLHFLNEGSRKMGVGIWKV
ncbi:hypothetical protein [Desulfobacter latus]|uniref:Uncharacterized protein n=1 Tax=Desulfobacter latus TaxID=2292 RepID=A0A850T7F3_9BACT|nr:hypothetical protein [Desulfobacter latus]NWH04985.1 hypothetical protein [Desulfobacter latus]